MKLVETLGFAAHNFNKRMKSYGSLLHTARISSSQ
jgi:hypothetical protein